jgi:hypothetical protein
MSKFGELFFENCLIGAIFSQKSLERVEIIFFLAKKKRKKNHPQKRNTVRDLSRLQKGFRI